MCHLRKVTGGIVIIIIIIIITIIITYFFTPWSKVLIEKLIGLHLFKKFPAFYGTRKFIIIIIIIIIIGAWGSVVVKALRY